MAPIYKKKNIPTLNKKKHNHFKAIYKKNKCISPNQTLLPKQLPPSQQPPNQTPPSINLTNEVTSKDNRVTTLSLVIIRIQITISLKVSQSASKE